jgi:hypothetical protein
LTVGEAPLRVTNDRDERGESRPNVRCAANNDQNLAALQLVEIGQKETQALQEKGVVTAAFNRRTVHTGTRTRHFSRRLRFFLIVFWQRAAKIRARRTLPQLCVNLVPDATHSRC